MHITGPINRHRLIVPHPRLALVAVDTTRGVSLPSVDTDDRHTADVDHVNAAALQRYGIRVTVRRSVFHGEPRDGVVERVHVLEMHGGDALEWRPAQTLLDELAGEDRRAHEPFEQVVRDFRARQLTPRSAVAAADIPPTRGEYAVTIADLGDFAADCYAADLSRWARATLERLA